MRGLVLAAAFALAVPVAAQDRTTPIVIETPPAQVVVYDTTLVELRLDTDSLSIAIQGAVAALERAIAASNGTAPDAGRDWYGYAKDVAWIGLAVWGILEFRKYRRNRTSVDVDVDVEVETPDYPPGTDSGESGHWVPPGHRGERPGRGRGRPGGGE